MSTNQSWDSKSIDNYTSPEKILKQEKRANRKYIKEHPELRAIVRVLIHEAINKKPEDVYQFGAEVFNFRNSPLLATKIHQQTKRVNDLILKGNYSEYDADELLHKTKSKESLLSEASIATSAVALLKYAILLKED